MFILRRPKSLDVSYLNLKPNCTPREGARGGSGLASRSFRPPRVILLWLLVAGSALAFDAFAARCLFVSSYHRGYAWSDGVESGLRAAVEGRCELRQFDMDTKRHKEPAQIEKIALEVRDLIEDWKPDVVITADDNAAKYLIKPYFKDHSLPFVFCGINWTVEEYGFPYSNVTGMIEIAPIAPLFDKALSLAPGASRGLYLGADTLTEGKNLARFEGEAKKRQVVLDHRLVGTTEAWIAAYREAQDNYDFVVMGSNSGINDWDSDRITAAQSQATKVFSFTNHGWMMPYTIVGLTKVPEEQGEWAGAAALLIIDGTKPADIPIIPNRKWDIWVNSALLQHAGLVLPEKLVRKAKKIE